MVARAAGAVVVRLPVPPGLCCVACRFPLAGELARRTPDGWVHSAPCLSDRELDGGRWVTVRGVRRWIPGGDGVAA